MMDIKSRIQIDCNEYCLTMEKVGFDGVEVEIEIKDREGYPSGYHYIYLSIDKIRDLIESEAS